MADGEKRFSRDPIADLVHDLRSPLAIIDGFAALLAKDTGKLTPEQRRDYATRIRNAATDMRGKLDATLE
jgi:signal transduction histidine kinase